MADQPRYIGSFRVNVYHGNSTEPLAEHVGTGDEWRVKPLLSVPLDDESYSVRVDTVWGDLLRGSRDHIEQQVEGLCTIVKFGDTMQLREPFRVVVEVNG